MVRYVIDIDEPKTCDDCPCFYLTEGMWRDECQLLPEEVIGDYYNVHPRPDWCPLRTFDEALMDDFLANQEPTRDEDCVTMRIELYKSEHDRLCDISLANRTSIAQTVAKLVDDEHERLLSNASDAS